MLSNVFASRLSAARKAKGWKKAELLRQIGREGRSNATGWEKGIIPDHETVVALAVKLGVIVDWLYGVDLIRGEAVAADAVELDAVVGGASTVLWGGRPLDADSRRRAHAILHDLLAPIGEIAEMSQNPKDRDFAPENTNRNRVQSVANIPASGSRKERPRRRNPQDDGGGGPRRIVGQGDDGGSSEPGSDPDDLA